jgi:hypothetical protein
MAEQQLSLFEDQELSGRVVGDGASRAQDPRSVALNDVGTIELSKALSQWDVVHVDPDHGYMIMSEREEGSYRLAGREGALYTMPPPERRAPGFRNSPGLSNDQATAEMGYSAPSPYFSTTRRDDNVKLHDQQGMRVYYNMRRQDGAVRASLRLLKTPIQSAHWFVEPASESVQDKKIADFVQDNLFWGLNVSWMQLLSDILLMCDYGYFAFEKVFRMGDDGMIRLQKLAPRHPLDIQMWEYDREGGPDGCWMYPNPYEGPALPTFIPINKLVVFSHEPEGGDISGISVLRSAYKHWYYKDTLYKIDAIQKERHGIGIPIIKLPPGFNKTDRQIADDLGRNLRTNERSHIVIPPLWEVVFAQLGGQPVDCMKSIEHHDMRIKSNVLGSFLDATTGTQDANIDIFLKSTRYIADYVCDIINTHIIPQMVNANFTLGMGRKYPCLRARRIGEWEDMRTLSFAIRNLIGSDAIRADDVLEAHLRKEMDLPPMDVTTSRSPVMVRPAMATTPLAPGETTAIADQALAFQASSQQGQQPGQAPNGQQKTNTPAPGATKAGAPRQSPVRVGTPQGNAGTDRSGK